MNAHSHRWWKHIAAAALLAGILALIPLARSFAIDAAFAAQSSQHNNMRPKIPAVRPPREQAMPFREGESLTYLVSWSAFSNAASLQLSAPERLELYGWRTWHFRGETHTLGPVRSLFQVDDHFDSYTDASTLESRQFEMHLHELGKIQDQVLHLTATGQSPRAPAPVVMVLPGTRDPLGALYALRAVDWQRTPEVRALVYDGHDVFEMRALREASGETVKVPAGTFSAARVSIRVFQHEKEVSAARFVMWFADDAAHTPVSFTADLPFGTLRGGLTAVYLPESE